MKKSKVSKKKTPKISKKTVAKPAKKKKAKKKYEHHPDHYNTSEDYLIQGLDEDLKDAWLKIREYGESLGLQRIYASGKAIMFSRKVCYFFVRPKKSFLEVVIFNQSEYISESFKSRVSTKTKWSHVFKLVHADQVEGDLTEAIAQAYQQTPE